MTDHEVLTLLESINTVKLYSDDKESFRMILSEFRFRERKKELDKVSYLSFKGLQKLILSEDKNYNKLLTKEQGYFKCNNGMYCVQSRFRCLITKEVNPNIPCITDKYPENQNNFENYIRNLLEKNSYRKVNLPSIEECEFQFKEIQTENKLKYRKHDSYRILYILGKDLPAMNLLYMIQMMKVFNVDYCYINKENPKTTPIIFMRNLSVTIDDNMGIVMPVMHSRQTTGFYLDVPSY